MNRDAAIAALADETLYPWTTGYVLRPLCEADADDLLAHFSDPDVTEFLDIEPFTGRDDVGQALEWADSIRELGQGVRWSIRDLDAPHAFLGTCGFHRLEYLQARRGELGYDLGPAYWGQGVMAQILPAMLDFAHAALGLHRVEALVTPGNVRSCRLLERHGFQREGVLRDYGFWRGAFQDQIVYGRLGTNA